MNPEIHCPRCAWESDGRARWQCHCGHVRNTFVTGAVCPQCRYRHRHTACPTAPSGCGQHSPHVGWYHDPGGLVKELLETAVPAALL